MRSIFDMGEFNGSRNFLYTMMSNKIFILLYLNYLSIYMNVHYYELFLSAAHKNTNLYCQPSLTRKIVLFCGKEDLILSLHLDIFPIVKILKENYFKCIYLMQCFVLIIFNRLICD